MPPKGHQEKRHMGPAERAGVPALMEPAAVAKGRAAQICKIMIGQIPGLTKQQYYYWRKQTPSHLLFGQNVQLYRSGRRISVTLAESIGEGIFREMGLDVRAWNLLSSTERQERDRQLIKLGLTSNKLALMLLKKQAAISAQAMPRRVRKRETGLDKFG